jgi:hypothetical protein
MGKWGIFLEVTLYSWNTSFSLRKMGSAPLCRQVAGDVSVCEVIKAGVQLSGRVCLACIWPSTKKKKKS